MLRLLLLDDETDQSQQGAVFAAVRWLLRTRLMLRRPITYIDATNLTRSDRRPYFRMAEAFNCTVEAIYFDVPIEVCQERNTRRGRQVATDVIERLARKLQPPRHEEGFRKIRVVDARGRSRVLRRPGSERASLRREPA